MTATLYVGDSLTVLRTLPAESVRCCVTSPPYWGLRDYGTAKWDGGDAGCDHIDASMNATSTYKTTDAKRAEMSKALFGSTYRDVCGKCGARRVDAQLGIERTPEEYTEKLVAVFREVRRVLTDDGTLWVNLGSSYGTRPQGGQNDFGSSTLTGGKGMRDPHRVSGDDTKPTRSRPGAPACGSDGTELPDSQSAGRACPGSGGEHQGENRTRRACTARTDQSGPQAERQISRTDRDTEPGGSDLAPPVASPPVAHPSTTQRSSDQPSDACDPGATASASQREHPTSPPGADPSADTSACTSGTSPMSPPLVVRTQGKESFFSACGRSDCLGVGRCGICWCNLAIPSLSFKQKDLVSIPQLVAFALQADGWYLRSDIIWSKPNPMPESVTDRPTKAHEYVFLLTKSQRYFYNADAIAEPGSVNVPWSDSSNKGTKIEAARGDSDSRSRLGKPARKSRHMRDTPRNDGDRWREVDGGVAPRGTRNARSVWTIATQPYPEAHFATFPEELARRCILAGSAPEDTVLDPFGGSGTVAAVAVGNGRNAIHIDLNPEYMELARNRIGPMLCEIADRYDAEGT